MTPHLAPRRYRIEQNVNQYSYFISWISEGQWAIQLSNPLHFLTKHHTFDIQDKEGQDTLFFITPEDALEYWKTYIEEIQKCQTNKTHKPPKPPKALPTT